MSRKKRRALSVEEQKLWDKIRETATPLRMAREPKIATLRKSVQAKPEPNQQTGIPRFSIGENARPSPMSTYKDPLATQTSLPASISMDRKNFTKLKRGKLMPDARLDLHGMTLDQAHSALLHFILGAFARGHRLVLVITGKGRTGADDGPIPARRGVLKHQVPTWLHSGPLQQAVLQVTEAHGKHGGSGAYYVYLRRKR